jgi:predicted esterase
MSESFNVFYRKVMAHYDAQDFATALDLLERDGDRYPKDAPTILYLSSCLAARLGQLGQAEAFLAQALDLGFWYNETLMRQSPSWAVLQGRPEFERLAAISIAQARQYAGTPRRFVAEPAGGIQPGQRYPLLIALHGNQDTGAAAFQAWQSAAEQGWIVAALQSSQAQMVDAYVWDDTDLATREILQHYADLTAQYPIDPSHIVLIGFSMGASQTLRMALADALPLHGFILLGPGAPGEPWMPPLPEQRAPAAQPLRGMILFGELEPQREGIHRLIAVLHHLDIPTHLEILPGLRHEYPDDGGATLRRALAFVME